MIKNSDTKRDIHKVRTPYEGVCVVVVVYVCGVERKRSGATTPYIQRRTNLLKGPRVK